MVEPGVWPGAGLAFSPGASTYSPLNVSSCGLTGDSFPDRPRHGLRALDEVGPVSLVHPVGRVAEHHLALGRRPADVIEVQVGEDHVGHVVRVTPQARRLSSS
jgi:hypothetical protein